MTPTEALGGNPAFGVHEKLSTGPNNWMQDLPTGASNNESRMHAELEPSPPWWRVTTRDWRGDVNANPICMRWATTASTTARGAGFWTGSQSWAGNVVAGCITLSYTTG
eukprot:8464435-Pyramimonas_sp.AAC.1